MDRERRCDKSSNCPHREYSDLSRKHVDQILGSIRDIFECHDEYYVYNRIGDDDMSEEVRHVVSEGIGMLEAFARSYVISCVMAGLMRPGVPLKHPRIAKRVSKVVRDSVLGILPVFLEDFNLCYHDFSLALFKVTPSTLIDVARRPEVVDNLVSAIHGHMKEHESKKDGTPFIPGFIVSSSDVRDALEKMVPGRAPEAKIDAQALHNKYEDLIKKLGKINTVDDFLKLG